MDLSTGKETPNTNPHDNDPPENSYRFAFGLITVLFFIFGFITCLNDVLVPHLKSLFVLTYTQASLIQFCFFSAYFVVSIPSGKLVTHLGYKTGIIIGLLITTLGCLLFYPAAGFQSYSFFLIGLFILASGITLIQVAVNPYVAVLGPKASAPARLTLAQAFNSLGTTLAPLFGSVLILSGVTPQASSAQGPYLGLALALVVLAAIVWISHLPAIKPRSDPADPSAQDRASAWKYRHLVLGAIGIFCYVGAEVAIGSYIVNFIGLPEIAALPSSDAAKYVSFYWGAAMVGRFVGSWILNKVGPSRVLAFNALFAGALVLVAMAFQGSLAMVSLLLVGFFNSIMFPTIFALAIAGLGKNTAQGSGILCTAIVGGAVVPLIQGGIADALGLHHSFWIPVVCYLFIAYYGLHGSREKRLASSR